MINHKVIGDFTLDVSDPYPVWITVSNEGGKLHFSHRELKDLIYALQCAEIECSPHAKGTAK